MKILNNTKFFIKQSKVYMLGEKVTPLMWFKAYIKFIWLSRHD